MPQYMLVLGGVTEEKRKTLTADYQMIAQKYAEWSEKLVHGGNMRGAHKLKDGEGRRLSLRDGKPTDGPYVESKESIGGYYIIEAKNYEEAVGLAKQCPTLLYQGGFVEVREIAI